MIVAQGNFGQQLQRPVSSMKVAHHTQLATVKLIVGSEPVRDVERVRAKTGRFPDGEILVQPQVSIASQEIDAVRAATTGFKIALPIVPVQSVSGIELAGTGHADPIGLLSVRAEV